ncbi:MAG: metallophosphoesterase [Candidatus Nanohaloarchaea archaeon]
MRVLLVTDIHGDVENLEKILEAEDYDAILCAGDLSDAREFDDYEGKLDDVLESMDRKEKLVKAVPGNMDPEEECVQKLIRTRMNLHKKIASIGNSEAVGFGGGQTPFGTPFEPSDEDISNALETLYDRMTADNRIAVIHNPPVDTNLDIADGDHVGSPAVRKIVEKKDFQLLLTGHIHESRGRTELNGTTCVNPGPVMDGYYGIAEVEDGEASVQMKQL